MRTVADWSIGSNRLAARREKSLERRAVRDGRRAHRLLAAARALWEAGSTLTVILSNAIARPPLSLVVRAEVACAH
jgi:hypothetical protein